MSKKQIKHFDTVCIRCVPYNVPKGENIKVQITTGYFDKETMVGEFWIPNNQHWLSREFSEIIKARAKHDLGVTYSHHSGANWYI